MVKKNNGSVETEKVYVINYKELDVFNFFTFVGLFLVFIGSSLGSIVFGFVLGGFLGFCSFIFGLGLFFIYVCILSIMLPDLDMILYNEKGKEYSVDDFDYVYDRCKG